jgi:replication factor C subunit 2/4
MCSLIKKDNYPWIEKYVPKSLEDIVGNTDVILRLKKVINEGNMQNMILVGPTGAGKTCSIHCLTRALLDSKIYDDAVLELNTSEDRGIGTVRTKIKMFAQKKVDLPSGVYKVIVIDEADSMTPGAQQALRRIIELYSYNTRFVFLCNEITEIIEAIQSRCCIFKYNKLSDKDIKSVIKGICEYENIDYTDEGLETILFTCVGDLRQAINNLQSTYSGYKVINYENVLKICDIPQPDLLNNIIKYSIENDFITSNQLIMKIYDMGYATIDIINCLFYVLKNYDIDEVIKMKMIKEIAFTNIRIINGVDTSTQLSGLISRLCQINNKN